MRSKKTASIVVVWGLVLVLLLSSGLAAAAPEKELSEFTLFGKYKRDPPYRVGFALALSGIDWTTQWEREFEIEAEAYKRAGIISEYYMLSAMGDVSKQISDIEDLLARGVDVLIIVPTSPTAIIPIVDRIYDEGKIPVVITHALYEGTKYSALRMIDDIGFGRVGAEWLVERLKEKFGRPKGNIIVLQGVPGHGCDVARWELGAKPVFEKYPEIKVVGVGAGDWAYDKARVVAESLVAANPVIDGVWTSGGQMTLAALDVFLEAGRPFVPMAGEDYNGLMKAWIKYKEQGFETIAPCKPTWMSRIALQTALNLLRGMSVKRYILYDAPYITWETVSKFVRENLPDYIWCNCALTEAELKELFKLD